MSKECDAVILDYLNKQNRPYSAIDVFTNLHKEHGKTAVVRSLESMAEAGKIREKVYGKQKVYCADQSQYPDIDAEELKLMDGKVLQLTEKYQQESAQLKQLEAKKQSLTSSLTTEEALIQLKQLQTECSQYHTRLGGLKNNANAVSPEQRQSIITVRSKYVKEWRKRKRMANDILDAILEGYPKKKKDLYDEVGVETDEDHSVKIPE